MTCLCHLWHQDEGLADYCQGECEPGKYVCPRCQDAGCEETMARNARAAARDAQWNAVG